MSEPGSADDHRNAVRQWRISALANELSKALRSPDRPPSPPDLKLEDGDMFYFATYVLSADAWRFDTDHVKDLVSLAMVPTKWPSDGFPALREAAGDSAKSGVCGKVWKQDELAYKCKTCERDPTCVVCVQCFKMGDHSGHDYAMVRTTGGCCDCGDVQAWRPDGFCRNHEGACAEDEDPAVSLPRALKRNIAEGVKAVAICILALCLRCRPHSRPRASHSLVTHAEGLLEWLAGIVQIGDGIRRVVGLQLIEPCIPWPNEDMFPNMSTALESASDSPKFSWLGIMLEIDGVDKLPMSVQAKLHAVYFQLITDLVFKRAFLETFVANYERYIHAQVARKKKLERRNLLTEDRRASTDIVENFTVQLFTVPALVPVMIRRGGLLDVLIDLLLNLFEASSGPVAPYSKGVPFSQSAYAEQHRTRVASAHSTSQPVASSSTSTRAAGQSQSLSVRFAGGEGPQMWALAPERRSDIHSQLQRSGDTQLDGDPATAGLRQGQVVPSEPSLPLPGDSTPNEPGHRFVRTSGLRSGALSSPTGSAALRVESADERPNTSGTLSTPVATADAQRLDFVGHVERNEAIGGDENPQAVAVDDDDTIDRITETVIEEGELRTDRHILENDVALPVHVVAVGGVEGDLGFPDFVIHTGEADDVGEDSEDGAEQPDGANDNDLNIQEQLDVFEDGLHFVPREHARLSRKEKGNSSFLSAVKEARQMGPAAIVGAGPIAHSMRLDWSHGEQKISDWVCWKVVNDLKYVLTHRAVAFHLVHVRQDLFRKFVRIMSMAQGMNPSARRFRDHVPIEADTWAKSFTIEIEFYYYVELLAVAFCGHKTSSPSPSKTSMDDEIEKVDLAASRLRCISIVRSCLDEWIDREEALEARSVFAGEYFSVAHSVTVHLPLHRFLAFMVHHVLRLDHVDLRNALSGGFAAATSEDAKRLLKHPLRVQAFLSQVRAGMWRRNGHPVVGQSMFYRSVFCSEWFVDLDLFLQQCCAVILGPDEFLREVQDSFRFGNFAAIIRLSSSGSQDDRQSDSRTEGLQRKAEEVEAETRNNQVSQESMHLSDLQSGKSIQSGSTIGFLPLAPRRYAVRGLFTPPTIPDVGNTYSELVEFVPTLIEDMLVYIVRICSERSRCGSGETEFLRRKLLHQLCSRDRTHSQLYRACSYRICNELNKGEEGENTIEGGENSDSLVESTLAAIADYLEPRGMEQGKYRLKDERWSEFDPFTPHLSPRDKCAAEVRHVTACKRQNRKMQVIPTDVVSERYTFRQLEGLRQIGKAVSGTAGLATEMLRKVLPQNGGPHPVEGALAAALHLVCAAVETTEEVDGESRYWLNAWQARGLFPGTAVGVVCEMYDVCQRSETNLYAEFVPVLQRILRQTSIRGNNSLRTLLMRMVPSLSQPQSSTAAPGQSSCVHTGSAEQERRKALLRKKKEQQAAAMARMRLAQASFARHIDAGGSAGSPSQGKLQHDSATNGRTVIDVDMSSNDGRNSREESYMPKMKRARGTLCDSVECALCHEMGSIDNDGTGLLGLVGFHQNTRLPAIARDHCRRPCPYRGERCASMSQSDEDVDARLLHVLDRFATNKGKSISPSNREGDYMGDNGNPGSSSVVASELRDSFFLNSQMLKNGVEDSEHLHLSFCGHAIHIHCFDRYFSSLLQSKANQTVFEGYNVLNLDRVEFLCPVCRRLANMALPLMDEVKTRIPSETIQGSKHEGVYLSYNNWVERCSLEVNHGWSRKASDRHIWSCKRSSGAIHASSSCREEKRETSSTMNTLGLSLISRGKAVLQKFGLQSFHSASTISAGSDVEQDMGGFGSYTKLPSAAISTAVCAEIAARSETWDGSSSVHTQRSLGTVLREARSQISLEPELRRQALVQLWKGVRSNQIARELDPFATLAFLFLLWSEPLDFYEAKNLARLGFDLVQLQRPENESNSIVTQAKLDFIVLLYLRRAGVLVSSYFASRSPPRLAQYNIDGSDATHDNVRVEILRLMKYFEIPTRPDPDIRLDLSEINTFELHSASLDFRPRRIGLIKLPQLFQTLLEDLDGKACTACQRNPKTPSLCLVCGDLICSNSTSCRSGRLSSHADDCGKGIGVFLVLKSTSVQIIRNERSSLWGSPYLDVHGEEDKKFSRGKPLYLNKERYASLERLWLTHGFDQDSRILSITMPARLVNAGL